MSFSVAADVASNAIESVVVAAVEPSEEDVVGQDLFSWTSHHHILTSSRIEENPFSNTG